MSKKELRYTKKDFQVGQEVYIERTYEQEIREKLPTSKKELPIDSSTLMTYVTEDQNYIELLNMIKLSVVNIDFNIDSSFLSTVVQRVKKLGLKPIGDIHGLLERYKDIFLRIWAIEMNIMHYTGILSLTPLLRITRVLESINRIDISDEEFIKISENLFLDEYGISYPTDVY